MEEHAPKSQRGPDASVVSPLKSVRSGWRERLPDLTRSAYGVAAVAVKRQA